MSTNQPPTPTPDDARRRWLAALLLRRPSGLAARLATGLARLGALPRGRRRRLQQRAAVSLAGAALILGMAGSALLAPTASRWSSSRRAPMRRMGWRCCICCVTGERERGRHRLWRGVKNCMRPETENSMSRPGDWRLHRDQTE